MKNFSSISMIFLLGACSMPPVRDPGYAAAAAQPPSPVKVNGGAIYQPGEALMLYENLRARRIGDMLTVRLVEATAASKSANTKTKKETDATIANPTIIGRPFRNLDTSLSSAQEFTGEGTSNQSNSLSGSVTVTVAEVLANGNLVVRGEKILSLNQGDERIRISGIVRPTDIQSDNSILSTQLADATIAYNGSGAMADANSMGWLARFFNSPWWPF